MKNEKSPNHRGEKDFYHHLKDTNYLSDSQGFLRMDVTKLMSLNDGLKNPEPLWKEAILDLSVKPEKPPILLTINGGRFATKGNISMITGKAKSKKTFLNSAITSSAISNNEVLGFSKPKKENKSLVLYYDTEQSPYDVYNVADRILKLGDFEKAPDNFIVFALKKYSTKDRIKIIEDSLDYYDNVDLIVIDGIRDLCNDFNDPKESSELVSKLMNWSVDKDLHVIVILHQNKGNDFARGHLGTELVNKCETVISVSNDKKSGIATVEPQEMREKDFEPFGFIIDENELPQLSNIPISEKKEKTKIEPTSFDDRMHIKVLKETYSNNRSYTFTNLVSALKLEWSKNHHQFGDNKLRDFITYYTNESFIINKGKSSRKAEYILNEKYYEDGMLC